MKYTIALIRGDGIGPEIVDSAVRVFRGHRPEIRP